MLGQAHHFRLYAPEKVAYGINRYTNEAKRLYGVINQRLSKSEFLGSSHYSIADIATWPWARSHEKQGVDLADYPNVLRWYEAIEKRPAVKRALALSSGQ
jgi:GST-like protein